MRRPSVTLAAVVIALSVVACGRTGDLRLPPKGQPEGEMSQFDPSRLHVRSQPGLTADKLSLPRRYTLTHSDQTGELFLTIADDYDQDQISGWYTRLMRDEVLAEWVVTPDGPVLDIHCHVSGGVVVGSAAWRDSILRTHMPQVIQTIRQGDAALFAAQVQLDQAPVRVYFHSHRPTLDRIEPWGVLGDYGPPDRGVSTTA